MSLAFFGLRWPSCYLCGHSFSVIMFNITDLVFLLFSSVEEMIASPFETCSDSFYFVNKLTMHHKAEYPFTPQRQTGAFWQM